MKKLRIAILASNIIRTPPNAKFMPEGASGSPETVISNITESMVKAGHDVTLFAAGSSITSAKLESISPRSTYEDPSIKMQDKDIFEYMLINKCYKMAQEGRFDIIHSGYIINDSYFTNLVNIPSISTLHLSGKSLPKVTELEKFIKDKHFYVSISFNQRKYYPELNYIGNVYHGIELKKFIFSDKYKENIVFQGRICPDKGIEDLLKISEMKDKKLLLLGTIDMDPEGTEKMRKRLNNSFIDFKGFVNRDELSTYINKSKVAIHPAIFEEPFGLSIIEYMACGIPVIAYSRGSIPEIIKDGETGFIVNPSDKDIRGNWIIKETGFKGLLKALETLYSLPKEKYLEMRYKCREEVEKNFTLDKMREGYEKVYMDAIKVNNSRIK